MTCHPTTKSEPDRPGRGVHVGGERPDLIFAEGLAAFEPRAVGQIAFNQAHQGGVVAVVLLDIADEGCRICLTRYATAMFGSTPLVAVSLSPCWLSLSMAGLTSSIIGKGFP